MFEKKSTGKSGMQLVYVCRSRNQRINKEQDEHSPHGDPDSGPCPVIPGTLVIFVTLGKKKNCQKKIHGQKEKNGQKIHCEKEL